MKILYILFATICLANINVVNAQQKTAYEKKKGELIGQSWTRFGQNAARYVSSLSMESDEEVFKKAKAVPLAERLLGRRTMEMSATIWYANELRKIQKLKTNIDLQYEKQAKIKKEQVEKEKQLQEQKSLFEATDMGKIKTKIKESFEKWNQKGEFEKVSDYEERLKNKSQETFSRMCSEKIKDQIHDYDMDDDGDGSLEKELSLYDSEKELFVITFKMNDETWQNSIKIPIEKAEAFKNNWTELRVKISDTDWCFVKKSLCPTLVTLVNVSDGSKYTFTSSLKNSVNISYSFDEIGIANSYLKGYVFRY